jgi:hypothetical protein
MRCGASRATVEETAGAAMKSDRRPDPRGAEVQECFNLDFDLVHGTFMDRRRAGHADIFTQVTGVLGQRDAEIASEIEGWLAGFVPAIVGGQSREARVQHIKPGAGWDVANGGAAPRMQEGGNHD